MKTLLSVLLFSAFTAAAMADIQEPPSSVMDPGRKFGRGLSNVFLGISEIPYTIACDTERNGDMALPNSAVHGVIRMFYRFGTGWHDVITFPFGDYKGDFRPPYTSPSWLNGNNGFTEFPPELGFESRYRYVRTYAGDAR